MNKQQLGFTLIELIMVIVILGILSAVAIPKFINLSTQAEEAAVEGIAGALSAGSAINYAASVAGHADAISVADCQAVAGTLEGTLDVAFSIGGTPPGCTVTRYGYTANFQGITVP